MANLHKKESFSNTLLWIESLQFKEWQEIFKSNQLANDDYHTRFYFQKVCLEKKTISKSHLYACSQWAPDVFNQSQKFYGLFHFCKTNKYVVLSKFIISWKQSYVSKLLTLLKFPIFKMTEKCHPIINHISFSTENLFEDSCFRSRYQIDFFCLFQTLVPLAT